MKLTNCRSCGSDKLVLVLDLGIQPWCNDFTTTPYSRKTYPLRLVACKECTLLQLDYTVPKEVMFLEHDYVSGTTKSLAKHFRDLAIENKDQFRLKSGDLVVDIGGNDGTQMLQYKAVGVENVVNVESAHNIAKLSEKAGVKTVNKFFNLETVKEEFEPNSARLINASGVFFHLEELHSVIEGIKYLLAGDGVLVVQFMYAGTMVEKLNFDTIYHEHLCYYTLKSLRHLLEPHGLTIFDAYPSDVHSGSIIAKITHSFKNVYAPTARYYETSEQDEEYTLDSFYSFASTIESKKGQLKELLNKIRDDGKSVWAYGAPAKGNTLLNYFGLDNMLVQKAVEINDLKVGKYTPRSGIPIVKESKDELPDYYLLLSHNFVDEILAKNQDILDKGVKFIVPFPEPKIVGKACEK